MNYYAGVREEIFSVDDIMSAWKGRVTGLSAESGKMRRERHNYSSNPTANSNKSRNFTRRFVDRQYEIIVDS